MTEQLESTTTSTTENKDSILSPPDSKVPSTPERLQRSSSSSSNKKNEPIIPSTPPLGSTRKFSSTNFQSPGDSGTTSKDVRPPATPSMSTTGKFKLSNVPETPFSAKSYDDSTTSPLKSPSHFQDNEDLEKPPIRQISSTLKARLSYAFVKYQHGWANQSLDELEKTVINRDSDLDEPFREFTSPNKSQSRTYEDFWNSNKDKSPHKYSPSKVTKPNNSLLKSPTKVKLEASVDQLEDDGSANLAFLQAISKSRSPKRRPHLQNNLRIDASKYPPIQQQQQQQNPEADAVETLMSLSSPQSFKPKPDFTHQQSLPKQRLSFGEHLTQQSPRQTQQQLPHHQFQQPHRHNHHQHHNQAQYQPNENAIETESDTEYEQSNTTDEEDVSTQSLSNGTKTENDEDVEIRATSNRGSTSPN